jgi:protein-L-isoaspartate O-methyltransferase
MRLDGDVLDVLAAAETEGNALRLTGQLDRALYVKVGKAIEAAGGKWNRKAQAHLFSGDAAATIAGLLEDGAVTSEQATQQFYPTPPAVVDRLLALAGLEQSYAVLEPSAGQGAIASRLAPLVAAVDCIELHEQHATAIRDAGYARNLTVGDFLLVEPEPAYDRVVMNPPFTRNADIAHVQHALQFLKPGGLLVAVMSLGVTFRQDRTNAAFRQMVNDAAGGFEALPDGSFTESGTGVKTVAAIIPEAAANTRAGSGEAAA